MRIALMALLAACGPSSSHAPGAATLPAAAPEGSPPPTWPSWGGVPWPLGDEVLVQALAQAELDRDPTAEAIEQAWQHPDPAFRARAAWTLARIGSPGARDRMSARLADGRITLDAPTLAAYAFLPAPGVEDRLDEAHDAAWDELEDRLWTRYAVTEDPAEADALLLAIARTGGPRSQTRLAADLAVLPPAEDEPRYAHGMEALAILCVRGHGLTEDGLNAVAQGLDGPTPVSRRAAAYALGRCAAVSAEQLAGAERGELVKRLGPMTIQGTAEAAQDVLVTRRTWAALEGLGELPRVVPGWVLGPEPTDWMTEVAAVRALAASADGRKVLARRLGQVDVTKWEGPRLHVLREALERLRPFAANEARLDEQLGALSSSIEAARRAEGTPARGKALAIIACEARLLMATRTGELEPVRGCAAGRPGLPAEHGERLAIEALVHMGPVLPREQRVAALLQYAADPRPGVAAPALGALAGLDDPSIARTLRAALGHEDMGVVAAAAGAIGTRAADQGRRDPEAAAALLAVLERFDDDHAVETRIAAIDALGRLARSATTSSVAAPAEGTTTDASPEPAASGDPASTPVVTPAAPPEPEPPPAWLETKILPLARDPSAAVRAAARRALRSHDELLAEFDATVPERFPDGFAPAVHEAVARLGRRVAGLRLHTDAGTITIDLTGAPAPIAQANLAALAERGLFDGLVFHRVVPGFVVQGGDPRGDGYGGPGHVMPCEWSNLRYERGTVGIALAGKDTGGSQLFIAHDEPHHLDARYTVIGKVVNGMDVIDAIWPYDAITKVEVLAERPVLAAGEALERAANGAP
jgi:cyclophilin family peptidyl-prolyl cis-trans isomerase